MHEKIIQTVDFLRSKMVRPPKIAMITGTGLGSLTEGMTDQVRLPYEEIPHFPRATIEGHKGTLVAGMLADKPVIAMEGRFHLYEGYTPAEITFPVRVMAMLGANHLLISSAAGGLNAEFERENLMIVTDHINLTGKNPLVGPNLDAFGPRFPSMTKVYAPELVELGKEEAMKSGILVRQGVYVGVEGPSLETPSETRFLRIIGADAVGMSTVSEAIVGVHCGLKIMAIVVITNMNVPNPSKETSLEEVIASAQRAGSRLATLWERIIKRLPV